MQVPTLSKPAIDDEDPCLPVVGGAVIAAMVLTTLDGDPETLRSPEVVADD